MTVATPTDQVAQVLAAARATDGVVAAETGRQGNGWTLVEVVPAAEPDSSQAALIARLRTGLPAAALVGGEGAERVDVKDASTRDTWLVIPIVLSVVLLVLFLLLRALAASLVVVERVLRQPEPAGAPPELEVLTAREREVLTLVGRGLTNGEIAERLVISPLTSKTYVSRLLTKLQARDRAQLVIAAYESGLVRAVGQEKPGDSSAGK